jgi:PAB-dependent poly(A)-specific ribonuclease subunit 2
MCFSPSASSDIVAGGASASALITGTVGRDDVILCINSGTGSVIRTSPSEAPVSHMRRSAKYVCTGNVAGHIQLRDPRSLNIEHRLVAHPGGLIDMQADGHHLYSVGWTLRLGHPVPEPLVKVHDLRSMRTMVHVPFAAQGGPSLLAVHPKVSSTITIASPSGHFQIVDINNLNEASFHQINTSTYLTSLAMSPSADFISFGEADGSVRLWASSPEATSFNSFSTSALEMPDLVEPPAAVNWTTETSLASIGLSFYDSALLSSISYDDYTSESSPLFNPPKKLDSAVIKTMRTVDNISYAPLPRHLKGKRNHVAGSGPGGMSAGGAAKSAANGRKPEDRRRVGIPLFRSEREREAAKRIANGIDQPDVEEAILSPGIAAAATGSMPSYYQVKTIQYSKFGVEDFDFGFYNQTAYSGLETHIQNSYANAYLQALHYLQPFRDLAKSHVMDMGPYAQLKNGCQRDNCLLCQAGFLFRMLEDAQGHNCQATNFLRALSSSERAASLGLMDKDDSPSAEVAYSNLIQTFNRFMLDTVALEAASAAWVKEDGQTDEEHNRMSQQQGGDAARLMSKLFCNTTSTKHTCATCNYTSTRENASHVVDLIYPRRALSNEREIPSDFATVLKASLIRETQTKATCRSCHAPMSVIRSKRTLPNTAELPQALSVNCAVNTGEQLRFWMDGANSTRSYLPTMISMNVNGDDVSIREVRQAEQQEEETKRGSAIYMLRSMVVQVQADQDIPHLIAIVNMGPSEDKDGKNQWYLFNDFLVRPLSAQEALSFPASWKVPAVLLWERIDRDVLNLSLSSSKADMDLLCQDLSISKHRELSLKRHTPLLANELPIEPGTIIAIDSEFVALDQEELELSSNGTRKLIRPSRLTLARVSVLRGNGDKEGEAFVDDFIWTKETVVDYLTQFSGIKRKSIQHCETCLYAYFYFINSG